MVLYVYLAFWRNSFSVDLVGNEKWPGMARAAVAQTGEEAKRKGVKRGSINAASL